MIDPSRTRQRERLLKSAMGEPYFPPVSMPVDVTDAEAFPNIAEARAWFAGLSAERRAVLEQEWGA